MIDTIKLKPLTSLPLAPFVSERLFPPAGKMPSGGGVDDLLPWQIKLVRDLRKPENATIAFNNPDNGIAISTNGNFVRSIQVSLSRVLHGSNGFLIKNPSELEAARERFIEAVRGIVAPFRQCDLKVRRLNLLYGPGMLISLHRLARHPSVRRQTQHYTSSQGSTLWFRGTHTEIKFYDKKAEVRGKQHQQPKGDAFVTRVEVSLKEEKQIQKRLGHAGSLRLDQLDFMTLYRTWRDILCEFDCPNYPKSKSPIAVYIASLLHHGVPVIGGMDPWDFYSHGKAHSTIRQMRGEVSRIQRETARFSWEEILPENSLPPVADIEADGWETIVLPEEPS